jgi:hypothetical protein
MNSHDQDLLLDNRARLAYERDQAAERRKRDIAEQTSASNTPEARIRLWEVRHQLTLPRDGEHPLVRVVADATKLSAIEVQDEQARRRLAATPVAAARAPHGSAVLGEADQAPPHASV